MAVDAVSDVLKEFADRLSDGLSAAVVGPEEADGAGASDASVAASFAESLGALLCGVARGGVDDTRVLSVMVELSRLLNLVNLALAGTVQVAAVAGIPFRKGCKTAAGLLLHLGQPPAVAYRLARVGRIGPSLPTVMAQARTGGVAIEQVDAIGRGVEFIEDRVDLDAEQRTAVIRSLSVQDVPAQVQMRARELAIALAPSTEPVADEAGAGAADNGDDQSVLPVAERSELNEMDVRMGADGRVSVQADVDVLLGEALLAALDPLCRPVPSPDGSPDPRGAGRRRADAFGQVVNSYLARSERPRSGGVLPHVSLVVPSTAEDHGGTGTGANPETGRAVASLGFGGPVSSATVGLVLCDAAVGRITVDGAGAPLDVGREQRLVTGPIRKALQIRDRGCAFPGCGRPVGWTDAHHCVPWSEGGATSVDNCVLLCRTHHTAVHHTGWEVFIGHDRHPWFREPADLARTGRERRVLRSHARRTLTLAADAAA